MFNIKCKIDFNDVFVYILDYGMFIDNMLVVVVFDIRNFLWCCVFFYWGKCLEVKIINWCLSNFNVFNILFVFLLLNLDKLFKVFGYEV